MMSSNKLMLACASVVGVSLLLWPVLRASEHAIAASASSHEMASAIRPVDGKTLAREAFYNEIQAQLRDHSLWCYQEMKQENRQKKLYGVCQATNGEIDRLLAVNSTRLDNAQQQAEDQRIRTLLDSSRELRRQQRKQEQDDEQTRNLMRVFSQAFRFQDAGTAGGLAEIRFTPDPNFRPSSRAERVFHHLEGMLFIDRRQKRIAEIDGVLTSEVKFLGGLLGHLDEGGRFQVRQEDLGSGHWELTRLHVQMTGKAIIFKTIDVQEDETCTDFRQEHQDTSLEQAFEELQREAPVEEAQRR
ncbi:MAG TPA: hypothetical protein VE077_22255 [Candidatus Methylomirabilis sp.]|nr:hypothetical protein [Candidatus Methylomirabilis sp.]